MKGCFYTGLPSIELEKHAYINSTNIRTDKTMRLAWGLGWGGEMRIIGLPGKFITLFRTLKISVRFRTYGIGDNLTNPRNKSGAGNHFKTEN